MQSFLNTIGATVIGGMVLLMIFGSIINMQALSHNMQQQMILGKIAEDLLTGRTIGSTTYAGLESYLSRVGAGVPSTFDPIIEASSNSFKFRGRLTIFSAVSTIHVVSQTAVNGAFPLYVYIDDMNNAVLGPFWLADPLSITYYDVDNNVIANPNSNISSIRSAKFVFNFTMETYRPDIDKRLVRYPTVVWKYFKNLYL
jgi:hypothetical protein